jgi:hypothetical protein
MTLDTEQLHALVPLPAELDVRLSAAAPEQVRLEQTQAVLRT